MIIYRVEDCTGEGMFRSDFTPIDVWGEPDDEVYEGPDHPRPSADIPALLDVKDNDWYFGCISLEQLNHWVDASPSARRRLHKEGFFIASYEAADEDILHGTKQVAFLKKHATLIGKEALCTTSGETTLMPSSMPDKSMSLVDLEGGIKYEGMAELSSGDVAQNVFACHSKPASEIMEPSPNMTF